MYIWGDKLVLQTWSQELNIFFESKGWDNHFELYNKAVSSWTSRDHVACKSGIWKDDEKMLL